LVNLFGCVSIVVLGRGFDEVLIVFGDAVRWILEVVVCDGERRVCFALLDCGRGLDTREADFGGDLAFGAAFAVWRFVLLTFFCSDDVFALSFFVPAAITGDDIAMQSDTTIAITREE